MIIGVTGTIGAGKGTVVDYLVQEKGFIHLSVRDYLLGEIRHRGMEVEDRSATREVDHELPATIGPALINAAL